ncbi:hypothetical protein DOQ08_02832 [Marinobacter litoralis]|uniref:Uncharacterized protein n=1 Tax=Marinobacter litoralis TaxID=187981 RepID=A0A3M2R9Y0_9GAMM|nr:hypothetical protein [Marinobacter litoralis]RMJ02041.1 hypothetical protein DOQ08_02832 [Marinobacter litoralis]
MVKSLALSSLLAILAGLIAFQYYITSVPSLEQPIKAENARYVDNDNSLLVSMVGSDGQSFTIGLRGDIVEKPEEAALFFISHPDIVPYVYWPGLRSNDEKRVTKVLSQWAENLNNPTTLEDRFTGTVHENDYPNADTAAHRIYSLLKNRN